MRILHFYKSYFPDTTGGVEKVIDQIAVGTAALGAHTEILTLTAEKTASTTTLHDYTVHHIPYDFSVASTPFSAAAISRFKDLATQADIIHYHFPWPFADLAHFLAHIKKPSIVTYHSDIIKQKKLLQLYKPLMYFFLSRVNHIVATSANYVASSPVLPRFSNKLSVIPIGLNRASYPKPNTEKLAYWQKKFGPQFFLFVGVMRYYKGLHVLLDAAQGIGVPIVIVGSGEPLEHKLKQHAATLRLNHVHFLGNIPEDDKIALLTLCSSVVLPSHLRSEAFGVFLLEGAMFGKPMISCDIGTGTTFINRANETGLVIPPNNPKALHQAMQFIVGHPQVAATMGKNAENHYWQHFTAQRMAQSYMGVYRHVINPIPHMQCA